jgi:hypothetical protein
VQQRDWQVGNSVAVELELLQINELVDLRRNINKTWVFTEVQDLKVFLGKKLLVY